MMGNKKQKQQKPFAAVIAALVISLALGWGVYAMGGSAFFGGSGTTVQSSTSNASVTGNTIAGSTTQIRQRREGR